jgi:diguanylate cyclase (GGDEF)-like protein/PAS domain S-box-containing protein
MIGATKEELIGHSCHQFVCPAPAGHCPITDYHEVIDNTGRLLLTAGGSAMPILKSAIPVMYHGEEHIMESFIDISRLKETEAELQQVIIAMKESEERYRSLVELSPDGIAIEADNKSVFMNPAGMQLLGASDPDRIIGLPVVDILHPDSKKRISKRVQKPGAVALVWEEEKFLRFDGRTIDVEVAGVPFYYNGRPAVQTIFRDITDRKTIEERLKRLALFDELTGLPNRSLFYDRVRQLLELAKRNNYVLALLYIDLDRFKSVNDALGHEMGDLLLKEVSRRLTSCTRRADTVARVGGDEFVGICGKIEAADHATVIAHKITEVLARPFNLRGKECTIGASIGISLFPEDGDDMEMLINKADAAMYRVKQTKKGGYLLYRDMKK